MALFKKQPETVLSIEGMHCAKCTARVTDALETIDGVVKVEVSLEENSARVTGAADKQAMVDAVNALGFKASLA